ncbi:hypothetical protein ANO11243_082930 [Dothideomycetidae sp. 11243]|nr:hypothetical protein ANO11243_082930 [fungal sp. No.11243]
MAPTTDNDRAGCPSSQEPHHDKHGRRVTQTASHGFDSNEAPRKRKRHSRHGDRKFACRFDGCDKMYGRAEHLYRHQLNHQPKQVYRCTHPGCDRRFVRQDLLVRHNERHEKGEAGQVRTTKARYDLAITYQDDSASLPIRHDANGVESRRDSTMGLQSNDAQTTTSSPKDALRRPATNNASFGRPGSSAFPLQDTDRTALDGQSLSLSTGPRPIPFYGLNTAARPGANGHGATSVQYKQEIASIAPQTNSSNNQFLAYSAPTSTAAHSVSPYTKYSSLLHQNPYRRQSDSFYPLPQPHSAQSLQYLSPTTYNVSATQPITNLTPFTAAQTARRPLYYQEPPSKKEPVLLHPPRGSPLRVSDNEDCNASPPSVPIPTIPGDLSMPVFNHDICQSVPFVSSDDFNIWLFDPEANSRSATSPHEGPAEDLVGIRSMIPSQIRRSTHVFSAFEDESARSQSDAPSQCFPRDPGPLRTFETTISFLRRKALIDLITRVFHDSQHEEITECRRSVLSGDRDVFPHVLSLPMLQTFLSAFWESVHPQMPILHRPTFATESCPDLLLLAMLALGASNLDSRHGKESRMRSSGFGVFLAWHTRFRLYQEVDFGPPAQLWVFQALLLLEIFEKMYSSHSLHERSHIHHSTTITLMRRGSSLIGRYIQDFPPYDSNNNVNRTPPCPNGSINRVGFNTHDPDWNAWISLEATRRIAFAAFIIDTTHAHMFGHAAVMVAHEMRIPLPCDEAMWAAESMVEVSEIQRALEAQGYSQIAFLDALKRTLNGKPVRTNTFGRVSIMAGLLSVSWHLKMQDVRTNSVGVGGKGNWGRQLMQAFDFWKKDFDTSLSLFAALHPSNSSLIPGGTLESTENSGSFQPSCRGELIHDNLFEARTVLHHLAHIAMHSDLLDCMMFAGATRLLGRVVTVKDRNAASQRVKETWAPGPRARDATFYALQFLFSVLLPNEGVPGVGPECFNYQLRDDVSFNRPWVLYLASMVVWSYGFALDGPLQYANSEGSVHHSRAAVLDHFNSRRVRVRDMREFLGWLKANIRTPQDLALLNGGRNTLLGMLLLLKEAFADAQWELLHEAAQSLGRCVDLLLPLTDENRK